MYQPIKAKHLWGQMSHVPLGQATWDTAHVFREPWHPR